MNLPKPVSKMPYNKIQALTSEKASDFWILEYHLPLILIWETIKAKKHKSRKQRKPQRSKVKQK